MIFKDRAQAGQKLYEALAKEPHVKTNKKHLVVVSLLRGGVVVGHEAARLINCPHLPLVVAKVGAPAQPELAIGAVCFDISYLEPQVIQQIGIDRKLIREA